MNLTWRSSWFVLVVPTMMAGPAALLGAWLGGSKTWLHIQDFELDAAEGLSILPRWRLVGSLLASVERWLIGRFGKVSTICDGMARRLAQKGRSSEESHVLTNWVDTQVIQPLAGESPLRQQLGIPPDKMVVLYAGNMGRKQGLTVLLDAARLLETDDRLVFLLFGDGVERKQIEVQASHLANVRMYPFQEPAHLNELLNLADIHVLPQLAGAEGAVLPSKLAGMLASGRPVVATASPDSDVGRIVSQAGLVTEPGSPEALAEGILRLAGDGALRHRLGDAGRAYAVDNLDKDVILGRMLKFLEGA